MYYKLAFTEPYDVQPEFSIKATIRMYILKIVVVESI